ncbi:alpha/beta hydrolase [Streptococcus halichoeri]|uniref:alpha/beta hydrolase n=1 Tax=Streptococcus halichoeri TaxID=254785 RepID=UPI00135ACADD|nr:alpha/beta hydrolase [Streptococcus halichoeri]
MKIVRLSKYLGLLLLALTLVSVGASFYFFHVAQVRAEKSFIDNGKRKPSDPLYASEQAFDRLTVQKKTMTRANIKQVAWYLPAAKPSDKTAIVVHGFANSKANMKPYAMLFHNLGYNVLMPDNQAHGESQGQIIGYGWQDRLNLIKWTQILLAENPKTDMTWFGLSMSAATVMMASGEEVPHQVSSIIEDCGYSSVWAELKYQAKAMYNLPAFPILYQVSALSKLKAGFSYQEASAIKQLQKNKRPVLFIHGDQDKFVPTAMVYDNYHATKGPKALYLVKGAKHAQSYKTNPSAYEEQIARFLQKYHQ